MLEGNQYLIFMILLQLENKRQSNFKNTAEIIVKNTSIKKILFLSVPFKAHLWYFD